MMGLVEHRVVLRSGRTSFPNYTTESNEQGSPIVEMLSCGDLMNNVMQKCKISPCKVVLKELEREVLLERNIQNDAQEKKQQDGRISKKQRRLFRTSETRDEGCLNHFDIRENGYRSQNDVKETWAAESVRLHPHQESPPSNFKTVNTDMKFDVSKCGRKTVMNLPTYVTRLEMTARNDQSRIDCSEHVALRQHNRDNSDRIVITPIDDSSISRSDQYVDLCSENDKEHRASKKESEGDTDEVTNGESREPPQNTCPKVTCFLSTKKSKNKMRLSESGYQHSKHGSYKVDTTYRNTPKWNQTGRLALRKARASIKSYFLLEDREVERAQKVSVVRDWLGFSGHHVGHEDATGPLSSQPLEDTAKHPTAAAKAAEQYVECEDAAEQYIAGKGTAEHHIAEKDAAEQHIAGEDAAVGTSMRIRTLGARGFPEHSIAGEDAAVGVSTRSRKGTIIFPEHIQGEAAAVGRSNRSKKWGTTDFAGDHIKGEGAAGGISTRPRKGTSLFSEHVEGEDTRVGVVLRSRDWRTTGSAEHVARDVAADGMTIRNRKRKTKDFLETGIAAKDAAEYHIVGGSASEDRIAGDGAAERRIACEDVAEHHVGYEDVAVGRSTCSRKWGTVGFSDLRNTLDGSEVDSSRRSCSLAGSGKKSSANCVTPELVRMKSVPESRRFANMRTAGSVCCYKAPYRKSEGHNKNLEECKVVLTDVRRLPIFSKVKRTKETESTLDKYGHSDTFNHANSRIDVYKCKIKDCRVLVTDIVNDKRYQNILNKRPVRPPIMYQSEPLFHKKRKLGQGKHSSTKELEGKNKIGTKQVKQTSRTRRKPVREGNGKEMRATRCGMIYFIEQVNKYKKKQKEGKIFRTNSQGNPLDEINRIFCRQRSFWDSIK